MCAYTVVQGYVLLRPAVLVLNLVLRSRVKDKLLNLVYSQWFIIRDTRVIESQPYHRLPYSRSQVDLD
eukprot:SAG31_NODE_3233_length_4512_cov_72.476773_4_plen_68_part_00